MPAVLLRPASLPPVCFSMLPCRSAGVYKNSSRQWARAVVMVMGKVVVRQWGEGAVRGWQRCGWGVWWCVVTNACKKIKSKQKMLC